MNDLEFKLDQLRREWLTAEVSERKVIEMRAKLIKVAIQLRGTVERKEMGVDDIRELFS